MTLFKKFAVAPYIVTGEKNLRTPALYLDCSSEDFALQLSILCFWARECGNKRLLGVQEGVKIFLL